MLIAYLERINPERNERRFYAIYWMDTLIGPAVVRVHGRKGAWARTLPPVFFPSLETAEPYIRRLIRRRVRRGYRLIERRDSADRGTAALAMALILSIIE